MAKTTKNMGFGSNGSAIQLLESLLKMVMELRDQVNGPGFKRLMDDMEKIKFVIGLVPNEDRSRVMEEIMKELKALKSSVDKIVNSKNVVSPLLCEQHKAEISKKIDEFMEEIRRKFATVDDVKKAVADVTEVKNNITSIKKEIKPLERRRIFFSFLRLYWKRILAYLTPLIGLVVFLFTYRVEILNTLIEIMKKIQPPTQ